MGKLKVLLPSPPLSALLAVSVFSWTTLLLSLEMGRTTPTTISLVQLAAAIVVGAILLIWGLLFGLLLRRVSALASHAVTTRVVITTIPLLLSVPSLVAIYLSDEVNHILTFTPILKALVLWPPPLLVLVWQVTILAWTARFQGDRTPWLWKQHSPPILIFAAFACLYTFGAGGHLYSPDEGYMYSVTQSLAERVPIATPNDDARTATGHTQLQYSKYGLVPSLLALPAYWISELLGPEPDSPSSAFPFPNSAYPLVDLLLNPVATAATCSLLYSLARRLGFHAASSLAVVIAYGMGTSAWVYSKTFFSQPLATLFLLCAVYLLVGKCRLSARDYSMAGFSLGLAAGTRAEIALLAVPLAIPLVRGLRNNSKGALHLLFVFGISLAASAGPTLGWYNYTKTGSVFMTGHGDQGTLAGFSPEPWIGLFGTLFSPGFGLFVYNPVVLLGITALPLLALRRQLEAHLFSGFLALAVLFYGSVGDWFGGFTWANRYLVVVLPFAVLPVAVLLERPWRSQISMLVVAGLVVLGISINLLGVLFDFNNGWQYLWQDRANLDLIMWDPHFSPIGAHIRLLHHFLFTGAKLDLYIYYKLGFPSLLAFVVLFAGLLTLTLRSALGEVGEASRAPSVRPGSALAPHPARLHEERGYLS